MRHYRSGWSWFLAAILPVTAASAQGPAMEAGNRAGLLGAPAAETRAVATERDELHADPAAGPVRLEVSLGERVLRVIQADSVLKSYPVAIGKSQHPTPRGRFQIRRVIWNPRWVPPAAPWARGKRARGPGDPENPMGRAKLFFQEPDYYIHGTNKEDSLGQAASHGCVRMANQDIVELARVVMEHGGEPRPADWFHRILNLVTTREVRLATPVSVAVVQ